MIRLLLAALLSSLTTSRDFVSDPQAAPKEVLPIGAKGAWDGSTIYGPCYVVHAGIHHLFYTGNGNVNPADPTAKMGIGYATSEDGEEWIKHGSAPVLTHPTEGRASSFKVMVEGERWIAVYAVPGRDYYPGSALYLATALNPAGPWETIDEPILVSTKESWNSISMPVSLFKHAGEYRLYFSGMNLTKKTTGFGLATSKDLKQWTFHDDPSTTAPLLAQSDPILSPGEEFDWDSVAMTGGSVLATRVGASFEWELYYIGYDRPIAQRGQELAPLWLGRATSQDGIHWNKDESNPLFETSERIWPLTHVVRKGNQYLFFQDTNGGRSGLRAFRH